MRPMGDGASRAQVATSMSFIFLSHSSRDDEAAGALREWLEAEGHEAVFLDHDAEGGIAGGEPWEERLYTELRRCRALVALVGPDWLASPWCVAEADHAQALRKPVLPLEIGPSAFSVQGHGCAGLVQGREVARQHGRPTTLRNTPEDADGGRCCLTHGV